MTLSMTFWFGAVLLSLRHPCSYADDCVCRQQSRQNLLRRTSPVRRSFNGGGSCFQLPTPQRQAPFAPSGPPGLRGTHLRFAAPHPLRPVIYKVHLALLRVTPKPPQRGMCAALRAKEEIVHPASIVDPSTPSGQLRSTLSVPGLLIQLPSQILLRQARYGWRLLPPHRASASFALRPPIASFRFSCLFVFFVVKPPFRIGELHANPAQALYYSGRPLIRKGHALVVASPSRADSLRGPYGLPCGAMEPSAEGALQFRRIRFAKFGHLLHSVAPLPLIVLRRRTRSLIGCRILRNAQSRIMPHYAFAPHISLSAPGSLKQKRFC